MYCKTRFSVAPLGLVLVAALAACSDRHDPLAVERGDVPAPRFSVGAPAAEGQLSAAEIHTCALRDGGGVECWGWDLFGQAPALRGDCPFHATFFLRPEHQ